jgi:hypothetical protein
MTYATNQLDLLFPNIGQLSLVVLNLIILVITILAGRPVGFDIV